ncbi:MAG: hypothetical protein GY749_27025 [Desulfobacteraceae bacterium]|nr:hypothetical protein [Desulfobacteraceae bacterium]
MSSNNITAEVDNRLDDLFGEGGDQEQDGTLEKKGTIEGRLDNFFGEAKKEGHGVVENKKKENPEKKRPVGIPEEDSQLKDLKSVVLSLEWEISDQVMDRLGEEIGKLEKQCKDDKIVVAFLQLLGSLGKYIQKKRAEAHPDSISLLNSVYDNLEQVMISEGLTEAVKKKMLVGEVNKYKKLKEQIAAVKTKAKTEERLVESVAAPVTEDAAVQEEEYTEPSVAEEPVYAGEEPAFPSAAAGSGSYEDVAKALERINQTLKAEFRSLRDELQLWRERG